MGKWTPEQQAEHRRAWIKALRSGDYKQTKHTLMVNIDDSGVGFCCLGVACDVYLKSGDAPKKAQWKGTSFVDGTRYKSLFNDSFDNKFIVRSVDVDLPPSVIDWLGLSSEDGHFTEKGNRTSLVDKNDGSGWSFKKIASLIEKEPEGLIKHGK